MATLQAVDAGAIPRLRKPHGITRTLLLAALLLIGVGGEAHAARKLRPTSFETTTFGSLRESFGGVQSRIEAAGPRFADLKPLLRRTATNLQYLNRLREKYDVPTEYLESLSGLNALLSEQALGEELGEQSAEAVREVADDLETKTRCARKRVEGVDDPPPFDPIEVTARTVKGGGEVSGCAVWAVLRGWKDSPRHFVRFDKFSSPTASRLAPGNYFFWSSRDQSDGPRLKTNLGEDGELKRAIDLETP